MKSIKKAAAASIAPRTFPCMLLGKYSGDVYIARTCDHGTEIHGSDVGKIYTNGNFNNQDLYLPFRGSIEIFSDEVNDVL